MRWKVLRTLCTLEFRDNRRLYDWYWTASPFLFTRASCRFSRLNLEYAMSKRKLNLLVTDKHVEG
ncbi:hypothetical protein DMI69_22020 [Escherichia coli]|nr:hypothetical protein [Escherichia coli]